MAWSMVISSAAVADPSLALKAVRFAKAASPSPPRLTCISQTPTTCFRVTGLRLKSGRIAAGSISRTYKQRSPSPVCLFGGKGKSGGDSEASPWKVFEKVIGKFKGSSLEDVLRKQIEKKEYFDDGDSGANPPRGGGGGFGGSDDEDPSEFWEEVQQVFFATVALIILYLFIIYGDELGKLIADYKYFRAGGEPSERLLSAWSGWETFKSILSSMLPAKKPRRMKDWLERAIVSTPTWWDSPEKYRHLRDMYVEQLRLRDMCLEELRRQQRESSSSPDAASLASK